MKNHTMNHTCSAAEVYATGEPKIPGKGEYGAQVAFIRADNQPKDVAALRKAGFHEAGRYRSSNGIGTVLVMLRINKHV